MAIASAGAIEEEFVEEEIEVEAEVEVEIIEAVEQYGP